ncbi:enoyl-CoA-hydratase DpgB [Streptosporangium sp. 'caverna']|uniref:enoyl-CoA-hydratase DpgB n=1 Tax=Streptosporangium sp. 'caverna' TaxID=2202249 RepID=UPI000D7DC0C0|nr:enoyl-CoA-hydratase DpgB [Streptosporangium sp. 'caverna']AWS44276.1 enoyl-CoA hydratase [Streptosporangium sp. 'caverna']
MSPVYSSGVVADIIDLRLQLDDPYWSSDDIIFKVSELCDRAEDSAVPRPVVLELAGPDPDAQAVTGWTKDVSVTLVNKWERVVRRLEWLGVPTIALVSGECSGQSLDLLLATDYRIGAPDVRLGVARSEGMLWPGMALHRLVQQFGMATARRMALFGRRLTAREALELGLLDEVTEDTAAAAAVVVGQAGELAGTELAVRRRLLLEAVVSSYEEALGGHLSAVDRTLRKGRADDCEEPR